MVALGELCTFQAGDAFAKERQGGNQGVVPFIKVSDMNLGGNELHIRVANNWLSTREAAEYRVHAPGAVVFAKIGEALKANRRRKLSMPTIIDNNMMSATASLGVDPDWLFYLLCKIDFVEISRGSALPYLAVSDLKKIRAPLPPLAVQQEVSFVLRSIDDKIELNRRLNETLEAMAQAIFRDWFIDLGPVQRKLAGAADPMAIMGQLISNPRRAGELARFLAEVEGWRTTPLREVADVDWGNTNLTKTAYTVEGYPAYSAAGPDGLIQNAERTGLGTVISAIGTVGNMYLAHGRWTAIKNTMTVQCRDAARHLFLHFALCSTSIPVRGSTQQFIALGDLRSLAVPNPPDDIVQAFSAVVGPLLEKCWASETENRTLAETRDCLLPRLMSGEVTVREAVQGIAA